MSWHYTVYTQSTIIPNNSIKPNQHCINECANIHRTFMAGDFCGRSGLPHLGVVLVLIFLMICFEVKSSSKMICDISISKASPIKTKMRNKSKSTTPATTEHDASDEMMTSSWPRPSDLKVNSALRLCRDTSDIDVIIELTRHAHPAVRQSALREMCPCRVKRDLSDFWNRVFEMTGDDSETVSCFFFLTVGLKCQMV